MNITQRAFSGGELAPALRARTDVAKYAFGLRTLRNFVIQPAGGVANRPGTTFAAEVKDSDQSARLVKFVFNADQTYVLEFGDQYIRWYQAGAPVVLGFVPAPWDTGIYEVGDLVTHNDIIYYCVVAHNDEEPPNPTYWHPLTGDIYEIPTPYAAADLAELQYVQSADVITLVHPSYPPHELRRHGHTRWILEAVDFAPSVDPPTNLALADGAAGDPLYWAVTALSVEQGDESLPAVINAADKVPSSGTPTTVSWNPPVGAISHNIYRSEDGVTYGFIGATGGAPGTVTKNTWTDDSESAATVVEGTVVASGQARITVVSSAEEKATYGTYTVQGRAIVLAASGRATGKLYFYYARDGEARVLAATLGGFEAEDTTTTEAFSQTISVPDNGYTSLVIDIVPEVTQIGDGQSACTADFTEAPNDRVTYEGFSSTVSFSDKGADPDYTIQPPVARTPFNATDRYPAAVGHYQQRRLFARTNTQPEHVWGSRIGSVRNFTVSTPLQDDDAVTWSLAGDEVHAVQSFVHLRTLFVLTSGGVYSIKGDASGALTPFGINPEQRSYEGASTLRPAKIGTRFLYVPRQGTGLRDVTQDDISGVVSSDLTVFSSHLFLGKTLVALDVQRTPYPIVWAARSDGVLLGLTYLPEQEVWGWHRHDTDGVIEDLCAIPEGTEDAVYLLVRRTIQGATRRYIERMATRLITDIVDACFLDASLVYDGRNTGSTTMTLSGGTAWTVDETLTCTASASTFVSSDVGNEVVLTAADGSALRCTITAYTSATVVSVRPQKTVPADLRATATTAWARAVDVVSGLEHLAGKAVGVFADGFVVASPANAAYPAVTVSSGGVVTLDRPYSVIRVGLPYLSDFETLDIDTPQGPSLKESALHIGRIGLTVEATRGFWAGRQAPALSGDPLAGLNEYKSREVSVGYDAPPALITDTVHVTVPGNWDAHGRIFVRNPDPIPLAILAAIPQGSIARGGT